MKKYNFFIILSNIIPKRSFVILFDLSLCVFSLWISFFLRMERFYYFNEIPIFPLLISLSLLVIIIFSFQIHKSINRYSGLETFIELSKALIIYSVIFSCFFTLNTFDNVPRTIGIIHPIILSFSILSSRALIRYVFLKLNKKNKSNKLNINCLIYGAGNAGRQLANIIKDDKNINFLGFLDDDKDLNKTKINNKTVYSSDKLDILRKRFKIDLVLLAIPSLDIANKTKILQSLQTLNITVRTLPDLNELASGKIDISHLRDLNINDLLGRKPIETKSLGPNINIKNKNVLITGGGGSIGSELCRQIAELSPKSIIIIEVNEYCLYSITNKIQEQISDKTINIIPKLTSILNFEVLENIFSIYKPNIIFHAAAYKHVKIVEENPIIGIENNVFGTLNLAKLSLKYKVANFVLISSDKAVRPSNIMGTSKRLSELIIQAFHNRTNSTIFCMVRFGNVLGSSGSVVPKFFEQIKTGGPITLTDIRVTRFFMTIHEAVNLVIKASTMAKGGEVFVLDMGDPIKIIDLAKKMTLLSGKTIKNNSNQNGNIEIKIVGLEPGEKLYEELLIGNNPIQTKEKKIFMAQENFLEWEKLENFLNDLKYYLKQNDLKNIKKIFIKTGTFYSK